MQPEEVSRRDFHKLSTAALCGLIAGTAFGCGEQAAAPGSKGTTPPPITAAPPTTPAVAAKTDAKADAKTAGKSAAAVTTVALHACRGLNECKGLGKSKKNDCAGKGDCYTVTHSCSGQNDCKYQGGCSGKHGTNDCKGQGGCGHFPIEDAAWKKAAPRSSRARRRPKRRSGRPPLPQRPSGDFGTRCR